MSQRGIAIHQSPPDFSIVLILPCEWLALMSLNKDLSQYESSSVSITYCRLGRHNGVPAAPD